MADKQRNGHRQRLRKRFLEGGLVKFTDEEILELLLTFGQPRIDCKSLSRKLLKEFRSLEAVLEADISRLKEVKGIGENNIIGIKFTHQVARHYLRQRMKGLDCITSVSEVVDFLRHTMMDARYEFCKVLYLDPGNRMVHEETISEGVSSLVEINIRKVLERALEHHSSAIILAHNHPGGDPHPSETDKSVTRELIFTCELLNVMVHDHLIIAENSYFSFAEYGMIEEYRAEAKRLRLKVRKEE